MNEERPTPVLTVRPIRAEIHFVVSDEMDGVSTGLRTVKAIVSEAEMNGIKLSELAEKACQHKPEGQ